MSLCIIFTGDLKAIGPGCSKSVGPNFGRFRSWDAEVSVLACEKRDFVLEMKDSDLLELAFFQC